MRTLAVLFALVPALIACDSEPENDEEQIAEQIEQSISASVSKRGVPLVSEKTFTFVADGVVREIESLRQPFAVAQNTRFCLYGSTVTAPLQARDVHEVLTRDAMNIWERLDQDPYDKGEVRTPPAWSDACQAPNDDIHVATLAAVSEDNKSIFVQIVAWQNEDTWAAYVGFDLDIDDPSTWSEAPSGHGGPKLDKAIQARTGGLSNAFQEALAPS